jgi:protein-tyrosine phosphatase
MLKKVLFVCLGNICRSPAAEGVMRRLVQQKGLLDQVVIASCGIGDWHVGQPPDYRIRQALLERGITLNTRAKVFTLNLLDEFDYIMASDPDVFGYLLSFASTPEQKAKLHLMTAYGKAFRGAAVPDPLYEGSAAFEHVLDILEDACTGLLEEIFP